MSGGPFSPLDRSTVVFSAASGTSARQFRASVNQKASVRVVNLGPDTAYIRFGDSSASAIIPSSGQLGDMAFPSGSTETFATNKTWLAAVCPSSAALHITPGFGA